MDLGEIEDDSHDLYDVDQNEEEVSYYFSRTYEKMVLSDIFVFNCYITKDISKIEKQIALHFVLYTKCLSKPPSFLCNSIN